MSGGKKTDKIIRLKEIVLQLEGELAAAKGHNSVLEAWRRAWLNGFPETSKVSVQTAMSALTDLWDELGAEHQTGAVMKLKTLKEQARKGTSLVNIQRAHDQASSSLHHQIFTLETAQRQLIFERDSARQAHHDQGFELANTKARVEELETAIRGVLASFESGEILEAHPGNYDLDGLASVLGDDHAEI